jgi:hypothetical protein
MHNLSSEAPRAGRYRAFVWRYCVFFWPQPTTFPTSSTPAVSGSKRRSLYDPIPFEHINELIVHVDQKHRRSAIFKAYRAYAATAKRPYAPSTFLARALVAGRLAGGVTRP